MESWFWIALGCIGVIILLIIIGAIIHSLRKPIKKSKTITIHNELPKVVAEKTLSEQILHANDEDDSNDVSDPDEVEDPITIANEGMPDDDTEEQERLFRKALKKSKSGTEVVDTDTSGINFIPIIGTIITIGLFIFVGVTLFNVIQPTLQTMNTSGSFTNVDDATVVNNMMSWFPWLIAGPIFIFIFMKIMRPFRYGGY